MKFLQLIRLPNLLIIALTQYLVRYTIIIPILEIFGQTSSVSGFNFFLLVFSTLCIAAGGYIINDYHDLQIDTINKPSKVIISSQLSKKWCIKIYLLLSTLGVLIGFYLTFVHKIHNVWMIHLLSVGLLWLYTSDLKKIFLAGNLVISFLTGLSLILLLLTDINAFNETTIRKLILGYTVFAFMLTLVREIIKDMEDKEGDAAFGRKTLPIVLGNKASKFLAAFFILILLFTLTSLQYSQHQWEDRISFLYVVISIELPLIALLIFLFRAGDKKNYHTSSLLSKGIMLTGVLSMLVFYLRYK